MAISGTKVREEIKPAGRVIAAPRTLPSTPLTAPVVRLRVQTTTRRKPRRSAAAVMLGALTGSFIATYMASQLLGHVLLEGERQQQIEARKRADSASRHSFALDVVRVASENPDRIDEWATSHGFVRAFAAPRPSLPSETYVAHR